MEDTKIVDMQEAAVEEVKKESKVISAIRKVGSGVKKNWKPIVVGAGAFLIGAMLASKKHDAPEVLDADFEEDTEPESSDETQGFDN